MARKLWANIFALREGRGSNITSEFGEWWENVDESDEWQRSIYYALCSSYALLSFVAFVQLVRIQIRVPEYGWTTQKVFHLMNFVVNGSRALLFGLYKSVLIIKPKVLEEVLMDFPGLLFFSTYALLVLFWAEIYHQARSTPGHQLRPAYFIINAIIYFIQVCIWISISTISDTTVGVEAAKLFLAVVSFCAAFGFLLYGGRLFVLLRRFPIESRGRQKKLYEVGSVTSICCACFMIRCVLLGISAFDKQADLDVLDHPIMNLLYYLGPIGVRHMYSTVHVVGFYWSSLHCRKTVEIVPSALVLFILRKLPPRRLSEQYQPIR